MKKSLFSLLAVLFIGFLIYSCKERKPITAAEDLENPTITMSSPEVVPLGQYVFLNSSDSFQVDIRFEDDIALRDYSITIRTRPEMAYNKTDNFAWKETWFGDLSGKSGGVNFPTTVAFDPNAGPYEFKVMVTDSSGKTAELTTYLFVTNTNDPLLPRVFFEMPDTNVVDTFAIGDTIFVKGNVSDGQQIRTARMRIRDEFSQQDLPNSFIFWDTLFVVQFDFDTFYTVPAGTAPGRYWLEFFGEDQTYNVGKGTDTLYIKQN